MQAENTSNGSWTSPATVGKFIAQVGLPSVLLVVVLIACFLVVTGLWPTPLMSGLDIIADVKAGQEGQTALLQEIRDITRTHCENDADTPEKMQKCVKP